MMEGAARQATLARHRFLAHFAEDAVAKEQFQAMGLGEKPEKSVLWLDEPSLDRRFILKLKR